MNYPKSELCDRYSIAMLKVERIGEPSCIEEYNELKKELSNDLILQDYIDVLYKINRQIWDLESDIRKGKESELGLEEVGRRAIAIRELNKKRVSVKNEIVKITNTGFIDVKMNHASE
jgi:hypothetical protein